MWEQLSVLVRVEVGAKQAQPFLSASQGVGCWQATGFHTHGIRVLRQCRKLLFGLGARYS